MKSTIKHTSIKNNPLIEIIEKDKKFGIHYQDGCKTESCMKHYSIKHNVEFPLERVIEDYIIHYGISKAIEILIGKGVINSINRPILIMAHR